MSVRTVEPFGPIAVIDPFEAIEKALEVANAVDVGLAAYVFSDPAARAARFANCLQAGDIILNNWNASFPETPFGGIKNSGYGREGGVEGIRDFMTTVFVGTQN